MSTQWLRRKVVQRMGRTSRVLGTADTSRSDKYARPGASSLGKVSTAPDDLRFAAMLADAGRLGDVRILPSKTGRLIM
jgi:hypothetical protein